MACAVFVRVDPAVYPMLVWEDAARDCFPLEQPAMVRKGSRARYLLLDPPAMAREDACACLGGLGLARVGAGGLPCVVDGRAYGGEGLCLRSSFALMVRNDLRA